MKWRELAIDPLFNIESYLDLQDKKIELLDNENHNLYAFIHNFIERLEHIRDNGSKKYIKENLDLVIKYMKIEFKEYYNLKVLKEKDVMKKVKMSSVEKLIKESEEMKAIEWLNKKRLDTSLTGIELNYLNILYYLILNLLEVSNETK